jgi:hypothetical protein
MTDFKIKRINRYGALSVGLPHVGKLVRIEEGKEGIFLRYVIEETVAQFQPPAEAVVVGDGVDTRDGGGAAMTPAVAVPEKRGRPRKSRAIVRSNNDAMFDENTIKNMSPEELDRFLESMFG